MISTVILIIILIYLALIGMLSNGFDKITEFNLSDKVPKTAFTIIIPFRNEQNHLDTLLKSLINLNYPKRLVEVILVDDDSEDKSQEVIKKVLKSNATSNFQIRVIKNVRVSKSPKKDAITTAISRAKYDWIITTDADCIVPKYWLDTYDEYIQSNEVHCVIGPVSIKNTSSFLQRFQALDFLSLQGVTIGGFGIKRPFLSNGANMAYLKHEFESLNGYNGNNHVASGDDVFLLEKFLGHNKKSVGYLKNNKCIVRTSTEESLKHLIQQRLRWASKTSKTSNNFTKFVGLIVFLANLSCVLLIPLTAIGIIFPRTAVLLFILKFSIDFLLLFKASRFFKQEQLLVSYPFASLIYPFFSVYIVFLSLFAPFNWKGRSYKY
jgi:cellulose synthase/poly-beta-1,6-N-acetylglucosamine synthase-like glycosyltransferase